MPNESALRSIPAIRDAPLSITRFEIFCPGTRAGPRDTAVYACSLPCPAPTAGRSG